MKKLKLKKKGKRKEKKLEKGFALFFHSKAFVAAFALMLEVANVLDQNMLVKGFPVDRGLFPTDTRCGERARCPGTAVRDIDEAQGPCKCLHEKLSLMLIFLERRRTNKKRLHEAK